MQQGLSGTVGTLYRPGKLFHQRNSEGRAYWIASLEYNSPGAVWFQRLMGADIAPPPGYVGMSSENELETPILMPKEGEKPIALRYTPESWFGNNLHRLLYNEPGMKGYSLKKWAFELDDDGMPQYVVALCRPTIRFSGERVEKYAIVNPQSGAIRYCEKNDLDSWVDDPMPQDIAQNNTNWWGLYPKTLGDSAWKHFWNTSGKDTVAAASNRQRLTWGANGKPYLFTGITSRNITDTSLVCHLLINPRTGEAFKVEAKGQDETAVLTAINNMVRYQHLHATDPVMYTLFGHRAWVSPVAGEGHLPMGLAIVDPDVRRPIYGTSKADAMLQWRQYLAQSTGDSKLSSTQERITVKGTIMAREIVSSNGKSQVFLRLTEQPGKVFVVEAVNGFEQAVVSMAGEKVELILLAFGDSRTSVEKFRNLEMPEERPEAE